MNYKKLSFLPFNMVLSVPYFVFLFISFTEIFKDNKTINYWEIVLISFLLYLKDAMDSTDKDYLSDEITELKNKLEKLEK